MAMAIAPFGMLWPLMALAIALFGKLWPLMALAIALFGKLWPLMALAIALFALLAVYTSLSICQTTFALKFSIICLGNCLSCERCALNSLPLYSTKAPPLDPIPRFIHGWPMAIALFKARRRPCTTMTFNLQDPENKY